MKPQVQRLWPTYLGPLPETLTADGIDWRIAIVRFGTGRLGHGPDVPDVALDFTTSADSFRTALGGLVHQIYGPTESGTEAIDLALSQLALRPGAAHLFILFSDENDDLPVSIQRGVLREPPQRWLTSPRTPIFQARLDATAQSLISAQVMVDFVINPKFQPSAFQYGSPAATVLDLAGHLDAAATLSALAAAQQQRSLQGQLLASGSCVASTCATGLAALTCTTDADCALRSRTFDLRGARRRSQAPVLFQSVVDDLRNAVACRP